MQTFAGVGLSDTIFKVEAKLDDHFITTWAIEIDWNPYETKGNTKLSILKTPFPITVFFFFLRKQQWRRAKKIMRGSSIILGPASEGIWSHHFMGNRWGNNGNSGRFYFGGLQNHCRW